MLIKDLIKLNPKVEEFKLQLYQDIAINKIKNYLNMADIKDDIIIKNYSIAIVLAVENEIENSKHKNIKSYKEGEQSITYENTRNTLSDEVKELLPFPKVRLL